MSTVMPADLPAEGSVEPSLAEGDEKKKQQRRGRKKSKLEDMFPAYLQVASRLPRVRGGSVPIGHQETISLDYSFLQEAFFGKELLDLSRKALFAVGVGRPGFGLGTQKPRGDGGSERKELNALHKGQLTEMTCSGVSSLPFCFIVGKGVWGRLGQLRVGQVCAPSPFVGIRCHL